MLVPSLPRSTHQDRIKHVRIFLRGRYGEKKIERELKEAGRVIRLWRKSDSRVMKGRKEGEEDHTIHSAVAWGKFSEAIRDMTCQSWRSEECPFSQQQHASVSVLHSFIGWEHWGRRGLAATRWTPETAARLGACQFLASLEVERGRFLLLAVVWPFRGKWRWCLVNREEKNY